MTSTSTGLVIWITGLPASGKSTLGRELGGALRQRGIAHIHLDSDDLREVLTPAASYTDEERDRFYGALGRVALRAAQGGTVAVVSATAPRRRYRDALRQETPQLTEVLLRCDGTTLRKRDQKGLYARADAGELPNLPGATGPYEEPADPELTLDSSSRRPEDLAAEVMTWLDERRLLTPAVFTTTHV